MQLPRRRTGGCRGDHHPQLVVGEGAPWVIDRDRPSGFTAYGVRWSMVMQYVATNSGNHGRPFILDPANDEQPGAGLPRDVDTPFNGRERSVFASVRGEFVECKADRLRRSWLQTQLGAAQGDTRTDDVSEGRKLGAKPGPQYRPLSIRSE
jgi:hypothetical protein